MGIDRTTRLLFAAGGVLVILALVLVVTTVLGNRTPPPPTPAPTATRLPTATPVPTGTPAPSPTPSVPPLDTPLPTDTPRPTETPAPPAPPTADTTADTGAGGSTASATPTPYLTPLRRPIVYSAMGASDTVGVGATNPATEAWPAVLAAHLPPGSHFARFARSGITLGDALKQELPATIASRPTLVTVWLAANDLTHQVPLTTYQQNLNTLLSRLTGETSAQIVLLNLPDLSLVLSPNRIPGGDTAGMRLLVQNWNRVIAATAAPYEDRVLLVDLFPETERINAEPGLLSGDEWHPSTAGYRAMGDLVYTTMLQAGLLPAR